MIHGVIRGGTTFDPVPRFGGGSHVTRMHVIALFIQPYSLRNPITGLNLLKKHFWFSFKMFVKALLLQNTFLIQFEQFIPFRYKPRAKLTENEIYSATHTTATVKIKKNVFYSLNPRKITFFDI